MHISISATRYRHVFHDQDQAPAELSEGELLAWELSVMINMFLAQGRIAAGWSGSFDNVSDSADRPGFP